MEIKLPIVDCEEGEITLHYYCESIWGWFEPWMVEKFDSKVFDVNGYQLEPRVVTKEFPRKFLWFRWTAKSKLVEVFHFDPPRKKEEELQKHLVDFMTSGKTIRRSELVNLAIPELLEIFREKLGPHVFG